MNHIRKTSRPTTRQLNRPASRRLAHACLRRVIPRRRGPDELSQALTAFKRATRCHRRLAKLAPRFFDSAVVNREIRDRAEQKRRRDIWDPVLNKVYGLAPDVSSYDPFEALPRLPSARTQLVVERELAELCCWMEVGRLAMDNYYLRQPDALPSSSQIARLLLISSEFGRLATGLGNSHPVPSRPSL